jgi:hypothetical protein
MPISTTLQQFFADRVGVDVVAHRLANSNVQA